MQIRWKTRQGGAGTRLQDKTVLQIRKVDKEESVFLEEPGFEQRKALDPKTLAANSSIFKKIQNTKSTKQRRIMKSRSHREKRPPGNACDRDKPSTNNESQRFEHHQGRKPAHSPSPILTPALSSGFEWLQPIHMCMCIKIQCIRTYTHLNK